MYKIRCWSIFDRPFANVSIKIGGVKHTFDSSLRNRIQFFKEREATKVFPIPNSLVENNGIQKNS